MWADVLTKPLQGQKFRDMRAFLQNCPRDYDDDVELQTDQLAQRSMNQQVKTVASLQECVREHAKLKTKQKTKLLSQPRPTSPTCVSRVTDPQINLQRDPQINLQPQPTSPTCLSRVTWGPTQVFPDERHKDNRSKGSHKHGDGN